MKVFLVFFVCFAFSLTEAQNGRQGGLNVISAASRGAAAGQASSSQSQSGTGVRVGGSTAVGAQTSSNGDSSADAAANGANFDNGTAADEQPSTPEVPAPAGSEETTQSTAATSQSVEDATDTSPAAPVLTTPRAKAREATTTQAAGVADNGLVGGAPVQTAAVYPVIVEGGAPPAQEPGVWDALDTLRGKPALTAEEIQAILATAVEGVDYPNLAEIPDQTGFSCVNEKQAGYYADTDSRCQVFRRCDINGIETSYLCPNKTLFNQIVLVCDWYFNVDCAKSAQFVDYSNSRLYHSTWAFLDTPAEVAVAAANATVVNQGKIAVASGQKIVQQQTKYAG